MIDPESHRKLKVEIEARIEEDKAILDQLRKEMRALRNNVRPIQPRVTTSISLVATDGGNNRIQYDPFLVQLIRVVDSSNNEYCLEAITPTTNLSALSASQFNSDGSPQSALGRMMNFLGVRELNKLSNMMVGGENDRPISDSWVQVYRELVEWAILFSIVRDNKFGSDTLIVFDGLLRSKVFAGELFKKLRRGIDEAINRHLTQYKRRIYIAGLAKHSKVLTRYRLAMALEQILTTDYPSYVEIPREIERKSYMWKEYAREDDDEGEANKFVGGKLFFVKFGNKSRDPIWPVDILNSQRTQAQVIIGFLLADALNGFPVPFYPLCLQKAHENAALVDFDFDILQDQIFEGIRSILDDEAPILDIARIQDEDPARARYL
jgi:hypothetical protein